MIYALIDKEGLCLRSLSIKEFSQKIQGLNIPIAQYRNKIGSLQEKKEDLELIRRYYKGILIINDTVELIDFVDGLHVGQEDIREYNSNLVLAVELLRKKIGSKLLGLSTHNKEEILEANVLNLDYIGLGAYRGTQTKLEAKILGEEALTLAKLSTHDVGLIGGVKLTDTFASSIYYKVIGSDLYEN